jgi:hypothetical protein
MLQAFICVQDIVHSSSQSYAYDGLVRVWMEANFRPVSRLCVAETWLAGGNNRGNFCNLWLRSSLHRTLSLRYCCVVVWAWAWDVEKLRRLGYSPVNIQMRQRTLVFTRVRKIAKSYYLLLPVSLSVHVCNNSAPTGRIFNEIWYLSIFRKSVENIHVWLTFYRPGADSFI